MGPESTTASKCNAHSTGRRHSFAQKFAREYAYNTPVNLDDTQGRSLFGSNDPESPLNPRSKKFDSRLWATNIAQFANEHGQNFRRIGLCFQNLNVFGYGTPIDFQKDVGNIWIALSDMACRFVFRRSGKTRIDILRRFNGIIRPGEMCVVLGPPGSGCSTFLRTISGETNGIHINDGSYLNYQGITAKEMHTAHRGDAIYTAEVDVHFPQLTVGETLTFASRARCQRDLPPEMSRDQ